MAQPVIPQALFRFLRELQSNNNRDWFNENKLRYQTEVRDPAVELVRQLDKPLARSAPMLSAIPKSHGGSVMRIYRDTRFSKDKTPYKTNVGISLRHQADTNIHAPGAYIHLAPDECFIGMGCWRPERNVLAAIRNAIDKDPKAWIKTRDHKKFRQDFEFAGERLKTTPRQYDKTHPMIDDLRRIDFIALATLSEAEMTSAEIVQILIARVRAARPLMQFLCDAIEVPY
ncbi:hypothetical protein Pla52o_50740 [Novipirellula galeiformis]|uniref:TIGR02453 family protein n=1 Tax=Novipirellula galeiformis TaxID=2528004 RepID=A0A5C6C067_9BACT|nr:DUF2461 domain-containing protein [Novipirellula galeiformis]TWU17518.1 hypothetical protein Pla52o_50740 [Novipirellula galeiformis]